MGRRVVTAGTRARSRALAEEWRRRAERLDEYAARCRREGIVQGPEGAEDAERAALEYRIAASELEGQAEARREELADG